MTVGKVIWVHPSLPEKAIQNARAGAVFYLNLSDLKYPPELRERGVRVRLLEHGNSVDLAIRCELVDEWPDAPDYYPPERAPSARLNPFSIYASEQRGRQYKALNEDLRSKGERY